MLERLGRAKWALRGFVLVMVLSAAGCGNSGGGDKTASAGVSSPPSSAAAGADIVSVEASNFQWKLSKTEFKAGQPIRFQITGKEGAHGFSIVGTDVSQPIKTGENAEVTWTPDKPGDYTIKCNSMCGSGHSSMETAIKVS